jgi:DHA3 family macrolide efflux protein-like MFS transporter
VPKILEKTSVWHDLVEGWKYVVGWPGLFAIILLAMLVNFLVNPAFSLLPLLVTDHFGKGAYELGFIDSTFGIGVIAGSLVLSVWGGFKNKIITSLLSLTISGLAVLSVGLAPSNMYLIALVGMTLFGFLNPITNGPLFAIIQTHVEPEIQGRVLSLLNAGATLASPLGLAVAGPLADATDNVQLWFIIGGILTSLASVLAFFIPAIIKMEDGRETEKIPEGSAQVSIHVPEGGVSEISQSELKQKFLPTEPGTN